MASIKILQDLRRFFILILFLFAQTSYASEVFNLEEVNGVLLAKIKLEPGSIIYWNKGTKIGLPTKIQFLNTDNLKGYHINWPWPKFKQDMGLTLAFYDDSLAIPIYIKPLDRNNSVKFEIKLSYLLCNELGCFPKEVLMPYEMKNFAAYNSEALDIKQKVFSKNGKILIEELKEKSETVIISKNTIYLPENYRQINGVMYAFFNVKNLSKDDKIEVLNSLSKNEFVINLSELEEHDANLSEVIIFAIYAIIGGFILNLMPCVLPVLSLKLYGLMDTKNHLEMRRLAGISLATNVTFFMIIGILTASAKTLGKLYLPGFNLQIPAIIIICMIVITYLLSVMREKVDFRINLMGAENFVSNNKNINAVMTTLISTILATPCTAPFLATSMAFAITQDITIILLMFLLSSLGFSLPYFVLIINPNVLSYLPKPGIWQKNLKNFFQLVLLATIGWLFWVLSSQIGYAASIFVVLMLYIFRIIVEKDITSFLKLSFLALYFTIIFTAPFSISSNFFKFENKIQTSWGKFSNKLLEDYINNEYIVFVYVTADWCVTCQVNKIMVLNRPDTIKLLEDNKIKLLEANLTNHNYEANDFLYRNDSPGIPFAAFYNKKNRKGYKLPVIFTYEDLREVITKIKK